MICKKCKKEILGGSLFCPYCGISQATRVRKAKSRGNGTGTIYRLPNGKYKVEVVLGYYKEDGKLKKIRKTGTFDKKKDGLAAISKLQAQKANNDKSPTLFELYEAYKSTRKYDKISDSQKDKMRFAWNKMKSIQVLKISDVTVAIMQKVIDENTSSYYPARDMKVLLSHLYTVAIQHSKETFNKTEYIELPDAPNAKRQVFTEEEIAKLWDDYYGQNPDGATEPHEFSGYILIMCYTGMRTGELFGIKKENIFLSDRYMIGGEKTEAGRDREIPINDSIFKVVEGLCGKNKKKLIHKNLDNFYEEYWNTIDRLKINHYPPLTCRHTYFTRLVQEKVHPALIAAMGGHAQYETAIDNYNRLPLKDKIDAANKL